MVCLFAPCILGRLTQGQMTIDRLTAYGGHLRSADNRVRPTTEKMIRASRPATPGDTVPFWGRYNESFARSPSSLLLLQRTVRNLRLKSIRSKWRQKKKLMRSLFRRLLYFGVVTILAPPAALSLSSSLS
jgi:hypothetical protein